MSRTDLLEGTEWIEAIPADAKLIARVWECGDDCGCSQAEIVISEERISPVGGWRWWDSRTVWWGNYYVDYSDYFEGSSRPSSELNRVAKYLRKHHNELFHRIVWPWNRVG